MSLYDLQRHLFDRLNMHDVTGERAHIDNYAVTDEEAEAVLEVDLVRMYELGVHPVLIQAFGRLSGLHTDDIKSQLHRLPTPEEGYAPWRNSH